MAHGIEKIPKLGRYPQKPCVERFFQTALR